MIGHHVNCRCEDCIRQLRRFRPAKAPSVNLRGRAEPVVKDCPCHGKQCTEQASGGVPCPTGTCSRMN